MTHDEHIEKARALVALAERTLDNGKRNGADFAAEAHACALLGICHLKLAGLDEPVLTVDEIRAPGGHSSRPFGAKTPPL